MLCRVGLRDSCRLGRSYPVRRHISRIAPHLVGTHDLRVERLIIVSGGFIKAGSIAPHQIFAEQRRSDGRVVLEIGFASDNRLRFGHMRRHRRHLHSFHLAGIRATAHGTLHHQATRVSLLPINQVAGAA